MCVHYLNKQHEAHRTNSTFIFLIQITLSTLEVLFRQRIVS